MEDVQSSVAGNHDDERCEECADPEFLAFVERLNADPEPESKAEASSAAAKSQDKPITALMAFLQEKHSRQKQSSAVAVKSRRNRESKARPVRLT